MTRTRLRRKLQPAHALIYLVLVPIMVVGIVDTLFIYPAPDIALMLAVVIGGGLSYVFFSDRGYQLSWDQDRFYVRAWGWAGVFRRHPEVAMAYDEVTQIEPGFSQTLGMKSRFMPFEYLEVTGQVGDEYREVWIYPPAFWDSEIKDFLRHFHQRRPELFSDEVVEFIWSDRPL